MTLRDLAWAAEAVRAERWNHTAHLMLATLRAAGDKRTKFRDLNPYLRKRRDEATETVGVEALKAVFINRRFPNAKEKAGRGGQAEAE